MRKFSENEKKYISILCKASNTESYSYLPINMLDGYFKKKNVSYTTNSQYLVFYRELKKLNSDEILAVENEILEVSLLLEYLEKNGLIVYIDDNTTVNENETLTIGAKKVEGSPIYEITKNTTEVIQKQLTKASNYRVFVSETLKELNRNECRSFEELQLDEARIQSKTAIKSLKEAKKQTWWSIRALIVAVVTMFVTIAVQMCYTQSVRVEEVKPSIIQTIKKEILPKHETKKKVLPTVQPAKQDSVKLTSGDKMKKNSSKIK